jgi:polyhydroxybutyrate depolymerase
MRGVQTTLVAGLLSCTPPDVAPMPSASAGASSAPTHLWPEKPPSRDIGTIGGRNAHPRGAIIDGSLPEGSVVPRSVETKQDARVPFVLVLHGYGGTGASFARHFQLSRLAEKRGFIYLAPDGEPDSRGNRFWNADPACCNFDGVAVDHSLVLGNLLEQAMAATRVDAQQVYVLGYSNGGFMAHRLGCDVAGIRGILSVAGAGISDPSRCAQAPEIVIEVHGDADAAVPFDGGHVLSRKDVPAHLGALATVTSWAKKKGCDGAPELAGTLDLEANLPDAETERLNFSCAKDVTLLKVRGAGHSLASSAAAIDVLMDALMK